MNDQIFALILVIWEFFTTFQIFQALICIMILLIEMCGGVLLFGLAVKMSEVLCSIFVELGLICNSCSYINVLLIQTLGGNCDVLKNAAITHVGDMYWDAAYQCQPWSNPREFGHLRIEPRGNIVSEYFEMNLLKRNCTGKCLD